MAALGAWILSWVADWAVQALIGLGIGVLTVTGIDVSVNQAVTWITNAVGGLPSDMANVLAMAGVFQGMSYVVGAFMARVAMAGASSIKKFFLK
jgi:hypothetical protein